MRLGDGKGVRGMNRWIIAGGLAIVSRKQKAHHYFEGLVDTIGRGMGRTERGGTRKRGGSAVQQWWRGRNQSVEKNFETKAGQCRVWWLELLRDLIT